MHRNLNATAAVLGIGTRKLRRRLRELGILDHAGELASAHRDRGYLFVATRSRWNRSINSWTHYGVVMTTEAGVASAGTAAGRRGATHAAPGRGRVMQQQGAQPMTITTAASTAHTQEGSGESSTLQLLRQRYRCNYINVEQLLQDHLPHISTTKGLLRAIDAGRVTIKLERLGEGRKATRIVYLRDLADWLDQTEKTAASQAA